MRPSPASPRRCGFYLAIENFVEGNDRINELRSSFGLPPIEIRWHSRFFREADFTKRVAPLFRSVEQVDFSSTYYLAMRVMYFEILRARG